MQVHYNINIRKLYFEANLCEVSAEDEKQHYCIVEIQDGQICCS